MPKSLYIAFIASSIFSATPAFANDAIILLNQMNDALHTLEYQGKLVYLKNGEFSNLSIHHSIENGAEKEVISSLDENGDEYVKESSAFSLSGLPKITPQMQKVYSFDLGGMGKVAGRPCRIVLARPKDRKRYLQKYCIDLDRSILLKYSLINQHHEPVERIMFTDFKILSSTNATEGLAEAKVEEAEDILDIVHVKQKAASENMKKSMAPVLDQHIGNALAPTLSAASAGEEPLAKSTANEVPAEAFDTSKAKTSPDQYSEWFFDPLPAGFSVVSADKVRNPEGEDEQIIISDGLSSVSVFITADDKNTKQIKPIQSGALNILSKAHQGHMVTLVGEVPESTLRDIFSGIKKATIDQ